MPLAFFALSAWYAKPRAFSPRLFARGVIVGAIAALIWFLAMPLFDPLWGSALLALSFFLRNWLLPFGLTLVGFWLAVGFGQGEPRAKVPLGQKAAPDLHDASSLYERSVPFCFGSLSAVGVAQAISSWGQVDALIALILPLSTLLAALALPALLEAAARSRPVPYALAGLAASLVASFGAAAFYLRLEWLGVVLTILFVGGVGTYGALRFLGEGRKRDGGARTQNMESRMEEESRI